jgi:hypothetical protein
MRGLKPDNLVAQIKHGDLKISSVTYDTGPRRVVFIVDTGRDLSRDAKKAEVEVVSYIVSRAPADTSFGLITSRGAKSEVRLGMPREQLAAELAHLLERSESGSSNDEEGALDAVMEGVGWFGNALPGDSILLMSSEIESNRRTKYAIVAKALADHHIRLFSFLLGPMVMGTVYNEFRTNYRGGLSSSSTVVANQENLSALTWNSGGYMVVENTEQPWKEYKLTEAHLDELRREGWQMYGAAAEFYIVRLVPVAQSVHDKQWTLELADSVHQRFPQAKALYPRELSFCEASKP